MEAERKKSGGAGTQPDRRRTVTAGGGHNRAQSNAPSVKKQVPVLQDGQLADLAGEAERAKQSGCYQLFWTWRRLYLLRQAELYQAGGQP